MLDLDLRHADWNDSDWSDGARLHSRPSVSDIVGRRIAADIRRDPYRYLLLLRFAAYNGAASMLLGAAAMQGWIGAVIDTDSSGLVIVIAAVFGLGMIVTARRALAISKELNEVRAAEPAAGSKSAAFLEQAMDVEPSRLPSLETALRLRIVGDIAQIRHLANSLVLFGLIGTILGFIMALRAVDPETAGDVAAVAPMISGLIEGLGVALYTTLVGAVLNLWLMMNYRILEGAAGRWLARLLERSGSDALNERSESHVAWS